MRRFLLITAVLFYSSNFLLAKNAPTQANIYDGHAPNAPSIAMGSAGAGLCSIASFYFNSANLFASQGASAQISALVSKQSDAESKYFSLADTSGTGLISAILVKDTSAFYWQSLSDTEVKVDHSSSNWHKVKTSVSQIGFMAAKLNDRNFSIGLNIAYLYGNISESSIIDTLPYANTSSGNGFAVDLSLAFPIAKNLILGINLKNIAGFMFWNNYNTEQLPFIFRTGIGYCDKGFTFALDWDKKFYRFDNLDKEHFYIGLEQYLNNIFCLRAGATANNSLENDKMKYSYGFGFKIKNYCLDFAGEQSKVDKESLTKFLISFSASVI